MKDAHTVGICAALGAMLGIACLASVPTMAWDQNPQGKCVDPRGCGSSPSPSPSYSPPPIDNSEAERAERNARYEQIRRTAQAALDRKDYREALRLLRQQQALRDGPNVQDAIAQVNALIAWHEAKTAADRRRAMAMRPSLFTQENVRYVEALEAKEKRDAENVKVAAKMREQIGKFAASLDTGPPEAGSVLIQGGTTGDAMGTQRAEARLEFGDPYALEARSEQARQGFDKAGPLMGSKPVISSDRIAGHSPIFSSALAAQVPDNAKNDPIITQALAWYQQLDKQKTEAVHKLSTAKEQLKRATGDPAVLAAQVGTLTNHIKQIETDQTKATHAAKGQVVNLGLQWNEIAAPITTETKTK